MDIRKIKKLIEMLQASDLREIEVKEGEESVRIARGGIVSPTEEYVISNQATQAIKTTTEEIHIDDSNASGNHIKSPIVGTFYRKPAPDKPPFVEVGDHVEKGQVVCIVEAMKMMNEIKSDFSGTIKSINVEDGTPVEFDQNLITVS
ncbi:MAG: acetyl-CoA carboxylase biotin carboxyl carrier protein [Gammaproteobacteria bacterium]|jgi:acetyl-CoA carboxylase biotin carboxyl carrier protein